MIFDDITFSFQRERPAAVAVLRAALYQGFKKCRFDHDFPRDIELVSFEQRFSDHRGFELLKQKE